MSAIESFALDVVNELVPEWMERLLTQLGLYLLLGVVSYFAIRTVKSRPPQTNDHSSGARLARCCVLGYAAEASDYRPKIVSRQGDDTTHQDRSPFMSAALLVYCCAGLMLAYLVWGFFQETIMSTTYQTGRFASSNFLVFCNRIAALLVAIPMMYRHQQDLGKAPFYKYGLTSLSNTLSSWCQLEALKYVSFPVQVLAKSSKIVPVMLMGTLLSGKRYPWYEYGVAVVITIGVSVFMLSQSTSSGGEKTTQFSGIVLMGGYLMSDSFTSQWQDVLFKEYELSSYQMMFGINAFSSIFTLLSLLSSGELFQSLEFLLANDMIIWHICAFSLAGAVGQTFIFLTIKEFGPLVFTIVSTVRQLIAIILSVVFFNHPITKEGFLGALAVFGAIVFRVWKKDHDARVAKELAKRAKSDEDPYYQQAA